MKYVILIPIYNDRDSLKLLIENINYEVKDLKSEISIIVINDASSQQIIDTYPNIENIHSIEIINMKENRGHARCNAFGLRYINSNETYDHVIIMDSDGEDRPIEIKDLINKIIEKPENSVVAKRVKRSEGLIFQTLYQIHKLITLIFTGKKVNFGNYSCLTKKDINILSDKASLWSSFSGTIKKNLKNLNETDSIRGLRYYGPSKMSLLNLVIHSFSIIAVFKYTVFLRSALIIIFLSFLINTLGLIAIVFQFLIVFFNLLIFIVSMRENQKALIESNNNLLNENEITH